MPPSISQEGQPTTTVMPIRFDSTWVFVRSAIVRELLSSTPWLSVPGSADLMPGVMTWKGRAIPVIDLYRALNLSALEPSKPRARVMIIEHSTGFAAIPIDGAREVTTITNDELRPPHASSIAYATGELTGPQREISTLIDLDRILCDVAAAGAGS